MRRTVILVLLLLLIPIKTHAATWEWIEDFTTNTLVDLAESNAYVYIHPDEGYAELPTLGIAATLRLKEDSYDQVLVTSAGIEYFSFTGAEMEKNPILSVDTNGSGIAIRQDSYSVWMMTDNEITRLDFDGGGMSNNDFLKITGRKNIVSISSQPHSDELAVLQRGEDGVGVIEYFGLAADGGGELVMDSLISFTAVATGSPVDVAVVPDTMDIIYATENAVIYYHFDEGSMSYIQNPFLSVTGLSDIKGLSVHDGGFAVLRADQKEHYLFTGEEMAYVESLSRDVPTGTVSIALKPDSYDFAVLNQDGKTHYYNFDGEGYVLNEALSAQGTQVPTGYYSPRNYVSKPINIEEETTGLVLTVTEEKPAGTTIQYSLIVDGVPTDVVPGVPLTLNENPAQIIVTATLFGGEETPRVTYLHLKSYNMGASSIKLNPFPVYRDFEDTEKPFSIYPEFPADFPAQYLADSSTLFQPIPIQAGSLIIFELEAMGEPNSVVITIEYRQNAVNSGAIPVPLERLTINKWVGTLQVDEDTPIGTEFWLAYVSMENEQGVVVLPSEGYMHMPFLEVIYDIDMDLLNFFDVHLTK